MNCAHAYAAAAMARRSWSCTTGSRRSSTDMPWPGPRPTTAAAVCREAFLTAWRCPAMFQDDRVPITLTLLQLARRRLGDTPPA